MQAPIPLEMAMPGTIMTHRLCIIELYIRQEQAMRWWSTAACSISLLEQILTAEPTTCTSSIQRLGSGIRYSKPRVTVTSIIKWAKSRIKSSATKVTATTRTTTSQWMTKQTSLFTICITSQVPWDSSTASPKRDQAQGPSLIGIVSSSLVAIREKVAPISTICSSIKSRKNNGMRLGNHTMKEIRCPRQGLIILLLDIRIDSMFMEVEMRCKSLKIFMNIRFWPINGNRFSIILIQRAILSIESCFHMRKKVLLPCLTTLLSSVSPTSDLGTQPLCTKVWCTYSEAGTEPKR